MEIIEALRAGFKIKKIIYAWNWAEWDSGMFKPFVNRFYKLKAESDWDETKSDEEREKYMQRIKLKHDIDLEPGKMRKNPGMRYFAKQCLNSVCFFL